MREIEFLSIECSWTHTDYWPQKYKLTLKDGTVTFVDVDKVDTYPNKVVFKEATP